MSFPFLLSSAVIEAALNDAVEERGQVLVRCFDVPDHWTVPRNGPYNGTAALNRVGLEVRAKHLERSR